MNSEHIALGKSSYDLIDRGKLFSELDLKEDTQFLDVACGSGAYSLAAARYLNQNGKDSESERSKER